MLTRLGFEPGGEQALGAKAAWEAGWQIRSAFRAARG